MIWLTRLNGERLVVNADLIELVEEQPDTRITLVTGRRFAVCESAEQVIERVVNYRRRVGAPGQHRPTIHAVRTESDGQEEEKP